MAAMMAEFMTPHFWWAVLQIVMIDILLGGDNAVVIALACRKLPGHQRTKGIVLGTAAAKLLRLLLVVFALKLLGIPWLKLVGAVLLVWIGIKLIAPEQHQGDENINASEHLWGAVRTIVIADLVMSLDNVLGIADAAAGEQHEVILVAFGLLLSIPIIIGGSQIILKLMERFPWIIVLGGMLLGWIAGDMAHSDPALARWLADAPMLRWVMATAGALLVLAAGQTLGFMRKPLTPH